MNDVRFDFAGRVAVVTGAAQRHRRRLRSRCSRRAGRASRCGTSTSRAATALAREPRRCAAPRAPSAATWRARRRSTLRCTRRSRRSAASTCSSTTPASSAPPISSRSREADWDAVLDVNLKGAFLVGQAVAREMVEARRRRDRQHELGQRRDGDPEHRQLQREQGRPRPADARDGAGAAPTRHPRQRRRAGHDRDRAGEEGGARQRRSRSSAS